MKVGSLVELVGRFKDYVPDFVTLPQKGIIYTIRSIKDGDADKREKFITLEEIVNPPNKYTGNEYSFFMDYFRELQPPIIISDIFENVTKETA